MCYGCWKEAGMPQIDNEKVRKAALMASDIYTWSLGMSGGELHIMLDDWNLEDWDIERLYADVEKFDEDGEFKSLMKRCLDVFKALSIDERYSALALSERLWKVDDVEFNTKMDLLDEQKM